MDRGLLIAGKVVPGTEWCARDPRAWWDGGEIGTKARGGPTTLLVGHWTAGPARVGESTASKVVQAMKGRKRPDGSRMNVGIHFVISWDGLIFQTADLAVATIHVSDATINSRAIGVETASPGTMAQAELLKVAGTFTKREVAKRTVQALDPPEALLAAWVKLADALASLPTDTGISIPRRVPALPNGTLLSDRFTPKQRTQWKGAMEHLHVPGTTKVDSATLLTGALCAAGWKTDTV